MCYNKTEANFKSHYILIIFDQHVDVLICVLINPSVPSHWLKTVAWPVGPVLKFRDIPDCWSRSYCLCPNSCWAGNRENLEIPHTWWHTTFDLGPYCRPNIFGLFSPDQFSDTSSPPCIKKMKGIGFGICNFLLYLSITCGYSNEKQHFMLSSVRKHLRKQKFTSTGSVSHVICLWYLW